MPENVSKSHKAFQKARHDFIKLTHRTEAALKREKKKQLRQLKRANTKLAKTRDRLIVVEKRIAEKGSAATRRQLRKLKHLYKKEMKAAAELRESIQPLTEKLKAMGAHIVSANYFGRGMEKIEKEIEKHLKKKSVKATKKAKKKSVKKRTVKKKAIKKKATKKKSVKKKAVKTAKKKKAVKKKAVKKKSTKKKATRK